MLYFFKNGGNMIESLAYKNMCRTESIENIKKFTEGNAENLNEELIYGGLLNAVMLGRDKDIIHYLFDKMPAESINSDYLFRVFVQYGLTELVKKFLDNGMDVAKHQHAFLQAGRFGHVDIVDLMTAKGCDVEKVKIFLKYKENIQKKEQEKLKE